MLAVSSLRRIAHSTSLRATGSLIEFCRSSACDVLPLRAAVTASFTVASSPVSRAGAVLAEAAELLAGGVFVFVAAPLLLPAALSFAVASFVADLSLVAALSFFAALSFVALLAAFVCSAGAPPAESACSAKPSTPAMARAVKMRVGACVLKVSSRFYRVIRRRGPVTYSVDKIDEALTGRGAEHYLRPRQKGGRAAIWGFHRARVNVKHEAACMAGPPLTAC